MPTPNPADKATSKPIILTQASHSGISALDLTTAPHHILVAIASAALVVAADWNNDNIKAETKDAADFLDALSTTIDNLDALYHPAVPGREDLMGIGLTVADYEDGYPVIRGGHIELVKATDLTVIEKAAVRQHLKFNMRAGEESADSFKARLAQFESEIAPAPDWRVA